MEMSEGFVSRMSSEESKTRVPVYVDVIVDEVRRPKIDHVYVDVHVYVHDLE